MAEREHDRIVELERALTQIRALASREFIAVTPPAEKLAQVLLVCNAVLQQRTLEAAMDDESRAALDRWGQGHA